MITVTFLVGCKILKGYGNGKVVLMIPLITTDLPFQFKRVNSQLNNFFSMTINQTYGQTFNVAGKD